MNRGLFILLLQIVISVGVTSIGVWAVTRPRHLQGFINENFALLPDAQRRSLIVSTLIRVAGLALILYGYTLVLNVWTEIVWLGRIFGVTSN